MEVTSVMQGINKTGFLLNHLASLLIHQNDQILQERLGLGFSQFKILRVLEAQPHIQQKQIADSLGQTEASISRQIKLLYQQGLLESRRRAENRRQHITTLTTKGLRYTEEAMRVLNDYHQPLFDQLTAKQQQQLLEILQTLHDHACDSPSDGPCQRFLGRPPVSTPTDPLINKLRKELTKHGSTQEKNGS